MREIFTYGSVGRAPGNRCLYPEADAKKPRALSLYHSFYSELTTIQTENPRVGGSILSLGTIKKQ